MIEHFDDAQRRPRRARDRAHRRRRAALLHRRRPPRRRRCRCRRSPRARPSAWSGDGSRMIRTGFQRLIEPILDCEKPVIVALNGTAAGGGVDARARGRPRDRGRHVAHHPGVRAPRASSPTAAARTCCPASSACTRPRSSSSSATTCPAADAERIGIVNKVVPAAELEATAERVGRAPRRRARPRPSAAPKKLLQPLARRRPRARSSRTRRCSSSSIVDTEDSTEGVASFRERRQHRVQGLVSVESSTLVAEGPRPRSSASARPRSARASPTPSCRSRARRSRWRSTTRASRRRRSTGSRRSRWSPAARSTSPATSASATSRSSPRSGTAAAPGAASSATRRWPSRPASADVAVAWRARKRASKTQPPVGAGASASASRTTGSGAGRSGLLRPVDEIAMLTRRYMHEYGATRDHLANVALAFRKHANRNPNADDVRASR